MILKRKHEICNECFHFRESETHYCCSLCDLYNWDKWFFTIETERVPENCIKKDKYMLAQGLDKV